MIEDALKLTVYFGERDRTADTYLADTLTEVYERHRLQASVLLRGAEGFGIKHHLRTDRLLTLSEDLPLASVAVDARERVQEALRDVRALSFDGLITLERARLIAETAEAAPELPWAAGEEAKLTVYVGRRERIGGRSAAEAIVSLFHEREVAGASVLLGVDGTLHGARHRARFIGRNARVPLMVVAVGDALRLAALVPEVSRLLPRPLLTLERVRVCKRDGRRLREPRRLPDQDAAGTGLWQKLMVYTGEQAQYEGEPLHERLVHDLRRSGAAGATVLRGVWGYHGTHAPHGDTLWQLRRRVPVVTVIVDRPSQIRRWFATVDRLTAETGLVTSENVPAFRATGPGISHGGLALAHRPE